MQQTVLLVEQNVERSNRQEFLLRLAGYRVRCFADVEEAINWNTACSAERTANLCLLLSTPGPMKEVVQRLQLLRSGWNELPILLINRALPPLAAHSNGCRQLACIGVHICEATEVTETLAAILQKRQGQVATPRLWREATRSALPEGCR